LTGACSRLTLTTSPCCVVNAHRMWRHDRTVNCLWPGPAKPRQFASRAGTHLRRVKAMSGLPTRRGPSAYEANFSNAAVAVGGHGWAYSRRGTSSSRWARQPMRARMSAMRKCGSLKAAVRRFAAPIDRFPNARTRSTDLRSASTSSGFESASGRSGVGLDRESRGGSFRPGSICTLESATLIVLVRSEAAPVQIEVRNAGAAIEQQRKCAAVPR
jgi:hypothetical protein